MNHTFKIYNCDFVMTHNDVNYEFEDVDDCTIEDPEFNRLTRGANSENKVGLPYREGTKEPKRVTLTMLGISIDHDPLLRSIFQDQSRVEFTVVDRVTGSGRAFKNAILCQEPLQLNVSESPDSMNVQLVFESFDMTTKIKEVEA